MNKKFWIILLLFIVVLLGFAAPALAGCDVSGTTDSQVTCSNPPDQDGVVTGAGNDQITVSTNAEVHSWQVAIDSGAGDDSITQRGTVFGGDHAIRLESGNNTLHNFGTIQGDNDGVRCLPQTYQTCSITNEGMITAVHETLDIISRGGRFFLRNTGTIMSTEEEALHLTGAGQYVIINDGVLRGQRQGIEIFGGRGVITNNGIITGVDFPTIDTDVYMDDITNWGELNAGAAPVIRSGGGNDTLRHYGIASSTNARINEAVINAGKGNDTIIVGGNITESGVGYAAVEAGQGSDTVIIRNGILNRPINGDDHAGTAYGNHDVLVFEFTGTASEIEAFKAAIASQTGERGSVMWRGKKYEWYGFEEITLKLTAR